MGVTDGERVAELAITGAELALVVGRPDGIWLLSHERRRAGVLRGPARATLLGQPVAVEKSADCRRGRERNVRVPLGEVEQELAWPPRRVGHAAGDEEGLDVRGRLARLSARDPGPVGECLGATVAVAGDPLVDGGPGDAEPAGELGDGVESVEVGGDEAGALHGGVSRGEGHRLREGEPCKPCARSIL